MIRRKTVQGSIVLKTVQELNSHATADEVYEEIKKTNPEMGRATVYRNLNKLCDMGLLRKRNIPGDAEHYDHDCTDHYHAKCLKCGRIFDVDMKVIPEIQKYIQEDHGFSITGYDIIFKGYCKECRGSTE